MAVPRHDRGRTRRAGEGLRRHRGARRAGGGAGAARAKAEAKAYRAPVVIAVSALPSDAPKVVRAEEFAATHAAVQNLLLAAHALGLAAIWRTGEPMYHPLMKQALGLAENGELVALIYLGKPEGAAARRASAGRPRRRRSGWPERADRADRGSVQACKKMKRAH